MIFTSASLKTFSTFNAEPWYLGCGERCDRKASFMPENQATLCRFNAYPRQPNTAASLMNALQGIKFNQGELKELNGDSIFMIVNKMVYFFRWNWHGLRPVILVTNYSGIPTLKSF